MGFGDLRTAWRGLMKNPAFTIVAALSLALGIGATTALFSVIYGVLISPYPYKDSKGIWSPSIESLKSNEGRGAYFGSEIRALEKLPGAASVMGTSPEGNMLLTGDFAPEILRGVRVTGNAFQFLGVPPVIGRTIQPTDIDANGEIAPVTVISFQLWQRLFAGDPGAVGKTLRLNDQIYTIVGVMPSRFGWWTSDGVWLPLSVDRVDRPRVMPLLRLRDGVTQEAMLQQLDALQQALAREQPDRFPREGLRSTLTNYLNITVASGEMENALKLLFGAVVFLLLIACANVANLQLARASTRVRETAVRLAIGANRGRIVRQLLTESLLLSFIGGASGLFLAYWTTALIARLMPDFMVPNEARIELNIWVLLFCLVVSTATGIIFGLSPALQTSKVDLTEALKDSTKGAGESIRGGKTRKALVVAEVALAAVLLISAALTIRTFATLQQVPIGFRAEGVITFGIPLARQRYPTFEARNRFAQEFLERIQKIPGVESASIGNGGMPFDGFDSDYEITSAAARNEQRRPLFMSLASADYLKAMGIPLLRGRMFTEKETSAGELVVVINETAAKLWRAGEDPIGKQISLNFLTNIGGNILKPENSSAQARVIGVMADIKNDGLRNPTRAAAVMPFTLLAPLQRGVAIRTQADSSTMMNSVRAELKAIDAEQPFYRFGTALQTISFEAVQPRFTMAFFTAFALVGLTLAACGIYSVLSFLVNRRTHEIGVRMALGARWSDILSLILSAGGRLVGIGLLLGLAGGLVITRLMEAHLFGVTTADPISYVVVAILLASVGLLACFIPARRAARMNPTEALRYE